MDRGPGCIECGGTGKRIDHLGVAHPCTHCGPGSVIRVPDDGEVEGAARNAGKASRKRTGQISAATSGASAIVPSTSRAQPFRRPRREPGPGST